MEHLREILSSPRAIRGMIEEWLIEVGLSLLLRGMIGLVPLKCSLYFICALLTDLLLAEMVSLKSLKGMPRPSAMIQLSWEHERPRPRFL